MSCPPHTGSKRRLIVLGSTGSIGVNTLDVVTHLRDTDHALQVVGLAAGRNVKRLIEQAKAFNVKHVAIADATLTSELQTSLPGVKVFGGQTGHDHRTGQQGNACGSRRFGNPCGGSI